MPQAAGTKTVEFDGQIHEFPSDFTDNDIQSALSLTSSSSSSLGGRGGGAISPPDPQPQAPNSVIGGFGRRAWNTAKGIWETITTPPQSIDEKLSPIPVPAYRVAKGAVQSEVKAGKQVGGQAAQAYRDARAGDVKGAIGDVGRAGVTAASMADPFATNTVADVNQMQDEGRTREAIGAGAFDVLTLLFGRAFGREPTPRTKLANLTGAIGDTGDTAKNLKPVLGEIEQTAKTAGKPITVGDLQSNIKLTKARLDAQFNQGLAPIANNPVMPTGIASRIRALVTPDMKMTADGRATAKYIESRAREFDKPWTYRQLNTTRMRAGADLESYYNKGSASQTNALRSNEDLAISKAINEGGKDIVYDGIDRANPKMDAKGLKQKQSNLIDLEKKLDDRVDELEDKQLAHESKTFGEKLNPRATVGASGAHGYVSRLGDLIPGGGPQKYANAKVARASGPSSAATARRVAVLALPVQHLQSTKKQAKGLPPPPEPAQ